MKTKIVAITNPIIEGVKSPGEFIAYAARVSNPTNQNNSKTAAKLLQYCIKHKHWSIFEMVNVVMEIETTRDIARQILRHRSFAFQEFSQRYADPINDLGVITREARLQDPTNRQNSIQIKDTVIDSDWRYRQNQVLATTIEAYDWAIAQGIAKEQARAILPEGLTKSKMYVNGTLRSWIHYCFLRMGPETQKEHREVAQSCWNQILEVFPELNEIEI